MFIAIDFDGTIVDHAYPEIGEPVPGAFEWMEKFKIAGANLILWTMRSDGGKDGDLLTEAVEFCRTRGIEFKFVNEHPQEWTNSPKVFAHLYIDDSAYGCPLLDNPRKGGRSYVDWNRVGPQVLQKTRAFGHPEGAIKDGWW